MTVERVIQGSPQEAHETVTVERMIQGLTARSPDETVTVEHNRRITVDSVALMDGS